MERQQEWARRAHHRRLSVCTAAGAAPPPPMAVVAPPSPASHGRPRARSGALPDWGSRGARGEGMKSSLQKLHGFALQRHEQRVDRDCDRGHSVAAAAAEDLLAAAQVCGPCISLRFCGCTNDPGLDGSVGCVFGKGRLLESSSTGGCGCPRRRGAASTPARAFVVGSGQDSLGEGNDLPTTITVCAGGKEMLALPVFYPRD